MSEDKNRDKDQEKKEKEPIEIPEIGFALKPKPGKGPGQKPEPEENSVQEEPKEKKPENTESEQPPEKEPEQEDATKKEPSLEERVQWALAGADEHDFGHDYDENKEDAETSPQKETVPEKSEHETIPDISSLQEIPSEDLNERIESEAGKIAEEPPAEPAQTHKEHTVSTLAASPKTLTTVFIIILSALAALLIGAILWNFSLYKQIADIKSKAISNAAIAKKLVSEKAKILQEYKPIKEQNDQLSKDLAATKDISNRFQKQVEILTTELTYIKKKSIEQQNSIKKYADEVKEIVSGKIEYYNAYIQEKENKEEMNLLIADLEDQIKTLNAELSSIDSEYLKKEGNYIYDMAFLYVKAGMYDEAISYFKDFLELNKDDADIYYNLALIYDQVKQDKANTIYCYEKYLECNPNAEDLYEITMRINSLKRGNVKKLPAETMKNFKINLNELKY
ncbi:MAG: hypothetical protein ABIH09_02640 [Candidatus Omnitrophota bacterium]